MNAAQLSPGQAVFYVDGINPWWSGVVSLIDEDAGMAAVLPDGEAFDVWVAFENIATRVPR